MHNLFFNLLMIIPTLQKNTITEIIYLTLIIIYDIIREIFILYRTS